MYPEFKFSKKALHRLFSGLMAAFLLAVTIPLANMMNASAAQLSSRSIQMSDSSRSGAGLTSTPGTGTNVSYKVQFTSSSANIEYVIIDFCDASPIIADSCTTPTNFSATGASASSTSFTVANTTGTTGGFFKANISGYAAGSNNITISGITNPSSVGTFYARILLFTNANIGTYTSAASPGSYADYGGIALSTTNAITITAKVQETLTFCVTNNDPNGVSSWTACSDNNATAAPALELGTGSPKVLGQTIDTGSVYSMVSTNASGGAAIRLRSSNQCTGLSTDGNTCSIAGIGGANSGAGGGSGGIAMQAGVANFGLDVDNYPVNNLPSPAVGTFNPDDDYDNTQNNYYTMLNDVTSTYGSDIASTIGQTTNVAYALGGKYTFAATAALTTPAGIYTANFSMIATGTF